MAERGEPADEELDEFGVWLRAELDDRDVSVRELGRRFAEHQKGDAETQRRQIHRHMRGERKVTPAMQKRYAAALGLPVAQVPTPEPQRLRELRRLLSKLSKTVESQTKNQTKMERQIGNLESRVRALETSSPTSSSEGAPGQPEQSAPPKTRRR